MGETGAGDGMEGKGETSADNQTTECRDRIPTSLDCPARLIFAWRAITTAQSILVKCMSFTSF